jgi:hypothetical protein
MEIRRQLLDPSALKSCKMRVKIDAEIMSTFFWQLPTGKGQKKNILNKFSSSIKFNVG